MLVRGQQTGDASEDFPALKKLPDIWLSDQETPRTAARGASTVPRTPVEVDNELWEVRAGHSWYCVGAILGATVGLLFTGAVHHDPAVDVVIVAGA